MKPAAQDHRRVFTEGPVNHPQDGDKSLSSGDIDPEQLQQLMNDPEIAAMFSKGKKNLGLGFWI